MMKVGSNYQPYPVYTTVLTGKNIPAHVGYRPRLQSKVFVEKKEEEALTKDKIAQTLYRESEAQTDPYEVDQAEVTDKNLEILTLGWLSWDKGLPAGVNEVNTIERARQKRAWDSALPVPFDEYSKEIRAVIVGAMEVNEWNYREEMIAAVGSLRIELAEKLAKEKARKNRSVYEERLMKYIQAKKEEKSRKIVKLRSNLNREVRKLTFAQKKVNRRYHRWNIIKQFTDKTSELYAPLMRFGEDPRHRHEKINPRFGYSKVFRKLEIMHQTVSSIPEPRKPAFDFNKNSKPRGPAKELCIRETKWTEANLEKLHDELRTIRRRRYIPPRQCFLKKRVAPHIAESEIPEVTGVTDEEEETFQACLFLQRTIKGRAIQSVMFEGRVKCQELIEELKSTHALQNDKEDVKAEMRRRVYGLQRQAEIEQMQERRKNEILCSLEGKTTGEMLDFLAKELLRLQDERKTHAMALAADQDRHRREAAEAGRRQVEEQRRREHEEMFKQTIKIHQNTVHAYLEDFTTEDAKWMSHAKAREKIAKKAKEMHQTALQSTFNPFEDRYVDKEDEEIIADLIHNFALPEAEKRIVRSRLAERQRNYLRICHDEVYSNIEKVVKGKRDLNGVLLSLPIEGKHKIPPPARVKYLHLKRMHDSSSSTMDSLSSVQWIVNEEIGQKIVEEEVELPQQTKQPPLPTPPTPPLPPPEQGFWSSGFSRQEVVLVEDKCAPKPETS